MRRTLATVLLLMLSQTACSKPAPKSIDELGAGNRAVTLKLIGAIEGGPGFSGYLYSYVSAGLKVHALVAVPDRPAPDSGYPVLIANHGHHPEPPKYGITADGTDWRPGDYYRRIPELFTAQGFMVVMPDYRGHNNSQGLEYTEGMLESSYYTEDVLNVLAGLDSLDAASRHEVFMWGHSMGAEVTLRALLATDRVKAASLWSTVGGDIWDQAYYYSRYGDPTAFDSSETPKSVIGTLKTSIAAFGPGFDYDGCEPLLHLDRLATPIVIQHAVGDRGAPYKWSETLATELYLLGKPYAFFSYPGDDHFFDGETMEQAARRDAEYFRNAMRPRE